MQKSNSETIKMSKMCEKNEQVEEAGALVLSQIHGAHPSFMHVRLPFRIATAMSMGACAQTGSGAGGCQVATGWDRWNSSALAGHGWLLDEARGGGWVA